MKFSQYRRLEQVGEGTYGKVFKAIHTETKKMFSLKEIHINPRNEGISLSTVREIKILQSCNHANIIKFHGVVMDEDDIQNPKIYLVLDFMDFDLKGIIDNKYSLTLDQIKNISFQILNGLNYLKSKRVLHRDLSSSNILLNKKGEIKICDFTLSRSQEFHNLTPQRKKYSFESDMWSCGALIAEIFLRRVLFKGSNSIDQLNRVVNVCGTEGWRGLKKAKNFRDFWPKKKIARSLRNLLLVNNVPEDGIDLLEKILQIDPRQRISCEEALRHPFFLGDEQNNTTRRFRLDYPSVYTFSRKEKRKRESDFERDKKRAKPF